MRKPLVLSVSLALGLTALIAAPVAAGDLVCKNGPAGPPIGGTISGNVIVPAGEECWLEYATVTGNIEVEQGAIYASIDLSMVEGSVVVGKDARTGLFGSEVMGDFKGSKCVEVEAQEWWDPNVLAEIRSQVHGDVQGDKCQQVRLTNTDVGGNVQVTKGKGYNPAVLESSTIGGNAQLEKNKSRWGGFPIYLLDNTIDGNCQATGNKPTMDIFVLGNTVKGSEEGQCRS